MIVITFLTASAFFAGFLSSIVIAASTLIRGVRIAFAAVARPVIGAARLVAYKIWHAITHLSGL
jgi:hypothetical protein